MSYEAIVCKLVHVREHPNADRLRLATAMGSQVVVGLDNYEGQVGVFFPADGQLSEEFAAENDLVGYTDEDGKKQGGYFAKNRRVRAQRFRGEKSDGWWCDLSLFNYIWEFQASVPPVGMKFTELSGKPICNKYETPATKKAQQQGKQYKHRRDTLWFKMMPDVKQLRNEHENVPGGALVTITEKLHGTSHRIGLVPDERPQGFFSRLFRRKAVMDWKFLSGSRRVIMRDSTVDAYYNDDFRGKVNAYFRDHLRPGEVFYMEIVGYTTEGALLMGSQNIAKLKDKAMRHMYGKKMEYTYGMLPGMFDVYVYRIAMVGGDGIELEYPWHAVKARCRQLKIRHVPEVCTPFVNRLWMDENETIKDIAEKYAVGPSLLSDKHIREGVVVRWDANGQTGWLKHKSFNFGVLEGYLKEDDSFVDREEAA